MASLWLLDLARVSPDDWRRLFAVLNAAERRRANRFIPPARRDQHIAAHGLKRLVLSSVLGVSPQALAFTAGPYGKPRLAEEDRLDFNLSHCDGLVGLAVVWGQAVGLDLEPTTRRVDEFVAGRMFSPAEQAWLAARPADGLALDRLRLWTLKEAYAKATGEGLTDGTTGCSIGIDPPRLLASPAVSSGWGLWQAEVAPTHLVAVAVRGADNSKPGFDAPDLGFGPACETIVVP